VGESFRFIVMDCNITYRREKLGEFILTPESEKTFWVQCKGYRCLALLTKDGKWKCFATGEELHNVLNVHSH
jgi:hypothetical protein